MARPLVRPEDSVVESWEMVVPGEVWIWIYDRREDQYKSQQLGLRTGTKTLHITRDDRKYNQELIPDENRHLDPFQNGSLRLLGSADRDQSLDVRNHYSDAELISMFEVRDPDLFQEAIEAIPSEVVLRRLANLSDNHATVNQNDSLRDLIVERYPVGGTQKTVREMYEAGERIGAGRI